MFHNPYICLNYQCGTVVNSAHIFPKHYKLAQQCIPMMHIDQQRKLTGNTKGTVKYLERCKVTMIVQDEVLTVVLKIQVFWDMRHVSLDSEVSATSIFTVLYDHSDP